MTCLSDPIVFPTGCSEIQLDFPQSFLCEWAPPKRSKGSRGREAVDAQSQSSSQTEGSDAAPAEKGVSDLDDPSDVSVACSSVESGAEQEVEERELESEGGDGGGEHAAVEAGAKALKGQYVLWSNGYCTLSNNLAKNEDGEYKYPDVKIRILPRLCTGAELGTSDMSRSRPVARYGDTKEQLATTVLVLKAWMAARARRNAWGTRSAYRKKVFSKELADLKREVRARGHPAGRTGVPEADAEMLKLLPDVFD